MTDEVVKERADEKVSGTFFLALASSRPRSSSPGHCESPKATWQSPSLS